MPEKSNSILISRPDAIGDVVLTLPLAGIIKSHWPDSRVLFLGRNYTQAVVECCKHVDRFISLDACRDQLSQTLSELSIDAIIHAFPDKDVVRAAHVAGIPRRIGSAKRWHTLTRLTDRHWFSRKQSDLHESQLNAKLLSSLGIEGLPSLSEIPGYYGFEHIPEAPDWSNLLLANDRPNLIFHPKSKGSAMDWPLEKWASLMQNIHPEEARIFVSGTEAEGELFRKVLPLNLPHVHDISGRMTLAEFIGFISRSDGLLACSTGPLHIAAAMGIHAIGLYTNERPMHAGRWAPVGNRVSILEGRHQGQELPFSAAEVRAVLPLRD